ncbi:MAG: Fe-S cluster assembly protein HesB [Actinobacteria bacterium]|nr:Fe-S cluster assembly protein HesB [Actinomycetota bacterium]
MQLHIAQDDEADSLLSRDPLALLIALVLDQQIPLERAFRSPLDLSMRLGGQLDAGAMAAMPPDEMKAIFSIKPALHRFPSSMASRVQELCRVVAQDYGGDASMIWKTARSGQELVERVAKLPGFGVQKAKIFTALLGKQMGVKPKGWQQACEPFGEAGTYRSIADIDSPGSLAAVRQYKLAMKAAAGASPSGTPSGSKANPARKGAKAKGSTSSTAAKSARPPSRSRG